MEWLLPLNEIVTDFFDQLKLISSGYGSFDYEDAGFVESNLVRLEILINDVPQQELAQICHMSKCREKGKAIVRKLKENLPRRQFGIKIQAAVGSNVVARESLQALRKDVTAKLYGGDTTRHMKLLANQAKGKAKLFEKQGQSIQVPKETFVKIFSRK